MKLSRSCKRFLLNIYVTLHYFEQYVHQYRIYFRRDKFHRVYHDLDQYCLFQFRRLNPDESLLHRHQVNYPLHIPTNVWHLQLSKYFFLLYTVRSFAIACFPVVRSTRSWRVLIGTEFLKNDSIYVETAVFFWSCICYLFLRFTLTSSLMNYKFMALFRMSTKKTNYFRPTLFGKYS